MTPLWEVLEPFLAGVGLLCIICGVIVVAIIVLDKTPVTELDLGERLEVTTVHRDLNGDVHIARRQVESPAVAAERILREEG